MVFFTIHFWQVDVWPETPEQVNMVTLYGPPVC